MNHQVQKFTFQEEIKELKEVKTRVSDREYMNLLDDILFRIMQDVKTNNT